MVYYMMPTVPKNLDGPTHDQIERGKRVGLWIRQAQSRINIKNNEAAKRCSISPSYYGILRNNCYDAANDRIKRPSEEIIARIAKGLESNTAEGLKAAGWIGDDFTPFTVALPSGRRAAILTADGSPIPLSEESLRRIDLEAELAERGQQRSEVGGQSVRPQAN